MSETPTDRIKREMEKHSKYLTKEQTESITREKLIERIEGYTGTLNGIHNLTTEALTKLYDTLVAYYKYGRTK